MFALQAGLAPAPYAHVGTSFEYRIVRALLFSLCLALVLLRRLLPWVRDPLVGGSARSRTLFGEARIIADSAIPYVFQAF